MNAHAPPFSSAICLMSEITLSSGRRYMARIWLKSCSKCAPARPSAVSQIALAAGADAAGTPLSSSAFRMSLRASGLPRALSTSNMRWA
jgi:hypothetical protein